MNDTPRLAKVWADTVGDPDYRQHETMELAMSLERELVAAHAEIVRLRALLAETQELHRIEKRDAALARDACAEAIAERDALQEVLCNAYDVYGTIGNDRQELTRIVDILQAALEGGK